MSAFCCRNRGSCGWACLGYGLGWLVVLTIGLGFRLPGLDRRPMHPDEANQAWKTGLLWQTGQYQYDPQEHHGPTLYYGTLSILWWTWPTDFASTTEVHYRLLTVLAGMGVIAGCLLLGKTLGPGAVLLAGGITAVSPMMVFYSRYYIHEMLLVLFTLGLLGCLAQGRQSRRRLGKIFWSALAGGCLGLMMATKETWILSVAAMGAGAVLTMGWNRWMDGQALPPPEPARREWGKGTLLMVMALGVAFGVAGAFYTGFGTHPEALWNAWKAYGLYFHRGMEAQDHSHPPLFYLERLVGYRARGVFWSEGSILALAAVGSIGLLWPEKKSRQGLPKSVLLAVREPVAGSPVAGHAETSGRQEACRVDRMFGRFWVFYTVGLTGLYSAIPYKTPWCGLSFWQGWIVLAGVGGGWLIRLAARSGNRLRKGLVGAGVAVLVGAGLGHLAWQSWRLNFDQRFYADPERNPWVYAHTAPHVLRLAERLEQLASLAPEGHRMQIHVIVRDNYWPLPWYLRRFDLDRIGYWQEAKTWGEACQRGPAPQVIIVQADLADQVDRRLPGPYNQQMLFCLRPEVFVRVYVQEELWEAFLKAMASAKAA